MEYNYKKSKLMSNDIVKNNLDLIYEYEDIDDFFTSDLVLHDRTFFIILKSKLQT